MDSTNSDYNFRFQSEIQGLRGIAVILVVLYHAGLLFTGGFIGVDVFFVISGYVITGSILHQAAQNKFSWASFVERRVRRLLPSLSAMIVLTLLMGVLLNPISTMEFARRTGVAAILVNANHYLLRQGGYFDGAAELNPFLHTWSLSVEEQFYIVFPIVVILSIGATFKLKRLRWVLWTLIALSAGLSLFLSYTPEIFGQSGPKLAFFLAATRSWEFGIGALLALAPKKLYSSSLAWIGLAGVIASAVFIGPEHIFPGVVVFIPVIATALLIAGGRNQNSLISKSLSHPYLVRIGDVSYGWYLWHWPFIVFVKGLEPSTSNFKLGFVAVLTVGIAFLNERWIENPFRHTSRLAKMDWRVVAMCAVFAPPIAWWWADKTQTEDYSLPLLRVSEMEEEYRDIGCDESDRNSREGTCNWGIGSQKVLLIGDSNARQHIPSLRQLDGYEFVARTRSACPLTERLMHQGVGLSECADWTREILLYIQETKPDIVIVAIAFDFYVSNQDFTFPHMDSNRDQFVNHLVSDVKKLTETVPTTFIIGEITKYRDADGYVSVFDCSALGVHLGAENGCIAWTKKISPIASGEMLPLPTLNPLEDGPTPKFFRDGGHLNTSGSFLYTNFWRDLLSQTTHL